MRIYIFKSQTKKGLCAFADDLVGGKLPRAHGPWTAVGVVGPKKNPPHNLPRDSIEKALNVDGFQLWRMKAPSPKMA
jgi:hypothetical protein